MTQEQQTQLTQQQINQLGRFFRGEKPLPTISNSVLT